VVLEPDLGWGQLTTEGVEVHEIPGDHFSILQEPGVEILAAHLRAQIDTVRAIGVHDPAANPGS
jgi:thioesterase domain-containing protein